MPKHIVKIRHYECGYCVNNLGLVFRGEGFRKRKFPAGVFLIKHRKYGYILFDTGYSREIYHLGFRGMIYRLFNPVYVGEEDEIGQKLRSDGMNAGEINYVILSHLHPDHIGGLKYFPNAKVVLSDAAFSSIGAGSLRGLIFRRLLPSWARENLLKISDRELMARGGYDLFGDDSIRLVKLDGHAVGQIGCLIDDKVLLAADACWGSDLLEKTDRMRWPAKIIQIDNVAYQDTARYLERLAEKGVKIYFSHDCHLGKELI